MALPWSKAISGVWHRSATGSMVRLVQGKRSAAQPGGRSKLRVTHRSFALPSVNYHQPDDKNPR